MSSLQDSLPPELPKAFLINTYVETFITTLVESGKASRCRYGGLKFPARLGRPREIWILVPTSVPDFVYDPVHQLTIKHLTVMIGGPRLGQRKLWQLANQKERRVRHLPGRHRYHSVERWLAAGTFSTDGKFGDVLLEPHCMEQGCMDSPCSWAGAVTNEQLKKAFVNMLEQYGAQPMLTSPLGSAHSAPEEPR